MGLPLNPLMLSTAYDFLRSTPPFRRWGLPISDEINFAITQHIDREGDSDWLDSGRFQIRISSKVISHTDNLLQVMAHEMVHLYEYRLGVRSHHGASFKRRAHRVCHYHGWDPLLFIGVIR